MDTLKIKRIIVLPVTLILIFNAFAQGNKMKKTVFKNEEIEIKFSGSFIIKEKGYFSSMVNKDYVDGYFFKFTKHIRFREDDVPKSYVTEDGEIIPTQHVITSDGYLCTMYILPVIEEKKLLAEIAIAFEPKNAGASYSGMKKLKIGEHQVIKWRAKRGKTRLDHFILQGKSHNYMLISSPYGDGEYIENIISEIKFLK